MVKPANAELGDLARTARADRIVAIDFESSGHYPMRAEDVLAKPAGFRPPGSVVEVGCVAIERRGGRWERAGTFHSYVNPDTKITRMAYQIHGISYATVRYAPRFRGIIDGLRDFVGDALLAAHASTNERDYSNYEFARAGAIAWGEQAYGPERWICTQRAFKRRVAKGEKTKLDAACDHYGIDRAGRVKHGALLDADLTADVLIAMLEDRVPQPALQAA